MNPTLRYSLSQKSRRKFHSGINLMRLLASPHMFRAICEPAANIEVPVDSLQCAAKRDEVLSVLATDMKVEFFSKKRPRFRSSGRPCPICTMRGGYRAIEGCKSRIAISEKARVVQFAFEEANFPCQFVERVFGRRKIEHLLQLRRLPDERHNVARIHSRPN